MTPYNFDMTLINPLTNALAHAPTSVLMLYPNSDSTGYMSVFTLKTYKMNQNDVQNVNKEQCWPYDVYVLCSRDVYWS